MTAVQTDTAHSRPLGAPPLLEVDDLSVIFRPTRRASPVHAVDGVSLSVAAGETVGLVGESGSGKSTLGQAVLGLVRPTSGTVRFDGQDITAADRTTRRKLSRDMQVIFQNPYGSLSPTRSIEQTLVEPLLAHQALTRDEARRRVADMLARSGCPRMRCSATPASSPEGSDSGSPSPER